MNGLGYSNKLTLKFESLLEIQRFVSFLAKKHEDVLLTPAIPHTMHDILQEYLNSPSPEAVLAVSFNVKTNIGINFENEDTNDNDSLRLWKPTSYKFLVRFIMFHSLDSLKIHPQFNLIQKGFLQNVKYLSSKGDFVEKITSAQDRIILWVNSNPFSLQQSIVHFIYRNTEIHSFLKAHRAKFFRIITIDNETCFLVINFGLFYALKVGTLFWTPVDNPIHTQLLIESFQYKVTKKMFTDEFYTSSFVTGLQTIKLYFGINTLMRCIFFTSPKWTPECKIRYNPNDNAKKKPIEPGNRFISQNDIQLAHLHYKSIFEIVDLYTKGEKDKTSLSLSHIFDSHFQIGSKKRYMIRYKEFASIYNALLQHLYELSEAIPENHWLRDIDGDYITVFRLLTILNETSHHYIVRHAQNEDDQWIEFKVPLLETANQHSSVYKAALECFEAYNRFDSTKHVLEYMSNSNSDHPIPRNTLTDAMMNVKFPETLFVSALDNINDVIQLNYQYIKVINYYNEIGDIASSFIDTPEQKASVIGRHILPRTIEETIYGLPAQYDPLEFQPKMDILYASLDSRKKNDNDEEVEETDERPVKRIRRDEYGRETKIYQRQHSQHTRQKIAMSQFITNMQKRIRNVNLSRESTNKVNHMITNDKERSPLTFSNFVASVLDGRSYDSMSILADEMNSWFVYHFYRMLFDSRLFAIFGNDNLKANTLLHFGQFPSGKDSISPLGIEYKQFVESMVSIKDDGHFNHWFECDTNIETDEKRTIFGESLKTLLYGKTESIPKIDCDAFKTYSSVPTKRGGKTAKFVYGKYTTNTFMAHINLIIYEAFVCGIKLPEWLTSYLLVDFLSSIPRRRKMNLEIN